MSRVLFEILATLSHSEFTQIGNEFQSASATYHFNFESFKKGVLKLLSCGLIEREDMSNPIFCNLTKLKITPKGLKALDYYEPLFYIGTMDAKEYLDSDFIGR